MRDDRFMYWSVSLFHSDYNNSTDLHIAVTTSTGCVVEFDRYGLRRHRPDNTRMSDWWQCLLVGDVPEPWYDYWDDILQQVSYAPLHITQMCVWVCECICMRMAARKAQLSVAPTASIRFAACQL